MVVFGVEQRKQCCDCLYFINVIVFFTLCFKNRLLSFDDTELHYLHIGILMTQGGRNGLGQPLRSFLVT